MKHIKESRGLTLVEVLATLVILSIVSLAVFGLLTNSLNQSAAQTTKANSQQQSNYLLMVWKDYHEKGNEYTIVISNDNTKVEFNSSSNHTVIENPSFEYYLTVVGQSKVNDSSVVTFTPRTQKTLTINITVQNVKDSTKKYDINTTLSRL